MSTGPQKKIDSKDIPKCLDDIVRKNRHELKIEHVTKEDLTPLHSSFQITNLKEILEKGFLYRLISFEPSRSDAIFLVAYVNEADHCRTLSTSKVVGFNPESNAILTRAGSQYVVNEFITDEPDELILIHICNTFSYGFVGDHFGIPSFPFRVRKRNNQITPN